MNIIIEKASPGDASNILEYLKLVGGETDYLTFGSEGMPFSAEAEESYIAEIEKSDDLMLVAKDGDRIIGIASLNRMPRRMSHRGDFGLSVAKDYWGRGIGSRLTEEVILFAKENRYEIIDLEVRSDNLRAIKLYEKYGFRKIGSHPAFLQIAGDNISSDYMYMNLKEENTKCSEN